MIECVNFVFILIEIFTRGFEIMPTPTLTSRAICYALLRRNWQVLGTLSRKAILVSAQTNSYVTPKHNGKAQPIFFNAKLILNKGASFTLTVYACLCIHFSLCVVFSKVITLSSETKVSTSETHRNAQNVCINSKCQHALFVQSIVTRKLNKITQ